MRSLARFVAMGALWGTIASAQGPAAFEVASIREVTTGVRVMGSFEASGNRAAYHGFGIAMLVAEAWNVRNDAVALGPEVSSQLAHPMMDVGRSAHVYEIAAQTAEGATPTRDQFRPMLQALLAERFHVKVHHETREARVYVLSASGASQLKPNTAEGSCKANYSRVPEGQRVVATHCPVDQLLHNLFVDRPIYDETGLTGFYDFTITSALPSQLSDPQAITPFSAAKELGLKLEAKTRPVDTIVIDHAEEPGEN